MALAIIAQPAEWTRWLGAGGLVACVWMDAVAGWLARRRTWLHSPFSRQSELLADFICFIWAPVAWVAADGLDWPAWAGAGVFVVAGAYRLARFQAEGLVRGGYRGLPVTYNGYLIPLAGLLAATILPWSQWIWPVVFVILAGLMCTTRFVVPEF